MSNYFSIQFTNNARFQFLSEESVTDKFDDVTVFFESNDGKICVFNDIIQEAIMKLHNGLKNQFELSADIEVGNLGEYYNIWANNLDDMLEDDEEEGIPVLNYWIWSTRDFQTWIYRKNEKLYIEISPSYRWHFVEPTKDEKIISFEEFQEHYRAYIIELSSEQINDIIESLEMMITELNINY
jgi:hypothetical protein